jgi:hypothetical protein
VIRAFGHPGYACGQKASCKINEGLRHQYSVSTGTSQGVNDR